MDTLLNRFLTYVSYDTQSKAHVRQVPGSEGQWRLVKRLQEELETLGLEEITLSEQGCLMATLPANIDHPVPVVGFIAHLDTSPEVSGKHIRAQVVENYRGGDIALGSGKEVLSPVMFPVLHRLHGHTLITTDGKTLLGADGKAGIAEIITALALLKQSSIPHGKIRVAFTPDGENGRGVTQFDVAAFGADWAYTLDGEGCGAFEYENFNAASATIKIVGNRIHTGYAKGVMVNALDLAMRFHCAIPSQQTPQTTCGDEGFWHLSQMKGNVERAELHYLIRDFTRETFYARKQQLITIAEQVGEGLHPDCYIEITLEDTYYNMREEVQKRPCIIDTTQAAMRDCGIEPVIRALRGGTDGSCLSFKGLPCPNLFSGGYNYHSRHEFASLEEMEKAVKVIMAIARRVALCR